MLELHSTASEPVSQAVARRQQFGYHSRLNYGIRGLARWVVVNTEKYVQYIDGRSEISNVQSAPTCKCYCGVTRLDHPGSRQAAN